MKHRATILLASVLAAASTGAPARAVGSATAGEPSVARLHVSLWPEYDRPGVLVMLEGELAPEEAIPAVLSLPIPAQVAAPHAVAWGDPPGWKLAQYTVRAEDRFNRVTISLPSRSFRLEYYADLGRADGRRSYSFEWPGGIAIGLLEYQVQIPPGAQEVTTTPPSPSRRVGEGGLTYLEGKLGPVATGSSARIEISYRRESDALTVPDAGQPKPAAPLTGAAGAAGGGLATAPTTPLPPTTPVPTTTAPSAQETTMWPVYVAAALLAGILIGFWLRRPSG